MKRVQAEIMIDGLKARGFKKVFSCDMTALFERMGNELEKELDAIAPDIASEDNLSDLEDGDISFEDADRLELLLIARENRVKVPMKCLDRFAKTKYSKPMYTDLKTFLESWLTAGFRKIPKRLEMCSMEDLEAHIEAEISSLTRAEILAFAEDYDLKLPTEDTTMDSLQNETMDTLLKKWWISDRKSFETMEPPPLDHYTMEVWSNGSHVNIFLDGSDDDGTQQTEHRYFQVGEKHAQENLSRVFDYLGWYMDDLIDTPEVEYLMAICSANLSMEQASVIEENGVYAYISRVEKLQDETASLRNKIERHQESLERKEKQLEEVKKDFTERTGYSGPPELAHIFSHLQDKLN